MGVTSAVDSLVLTNTTPQYSQAISMQGGNAVQPQVVLPVMSATSLTLGLEGSNDLSNWSPITVAGSWSGLTLGYPTQPAAQGSIAWQYVRLKFTLVGAGTIIVNANVSTAML